MADSQPDISGGSAPTKDEQSLQQPRGAVQLKEMGDDRADAERAPTIPPKDNEPPVGGPGQAEGSGDAAGTPSSKGKEKEGLPPAPIEKMARQEDSLAIEPTDAPAITANSSEGPVCNITLLLPTGARHPYRIDEKYLSKRNVDVPDLTESGKKDPFSISIYKLKELILREWRDEWDGKPASPSSIRLIHFGKLLEDKEQLKKYQFSAESPNVVHMSVRPAEMMEEDEAGKGKSGGRDGRNRERGSGCCVIL